MEHNLNPKGGIVRKIELGRARNFAWVTFHNARYAMLCLQLHGIFLLGKKLKVGRSYAQIRDESDDRLYIQQIKEKRIAEYPEQCQQNLSQDQILALRQQRIKEVGGAAGGSHSIISRFSQGANALGIIAIPNELEKIEILGLEPGPSSNSSKGTTVTVVSGTVGVQNSNSVTGGIITSSNSINGPNGTSTGTKSLKDSSDNHTSTISATSSQKKLVNSDPLAGTSTGGVDLHVAKAAKAVGTTAQALTASLNAAAGVGPNGSADFSNLASTVAGIAGIGKAGIGVTSMLQSSIAQASGLNRFDPTLNINTTGHGAIGGSNMMNSAALQTQTANSRMLCALQIPHDVPRERIEKLLEKLGKLKQTVQIVEYSDPNIIDTKTNQKLKYQAAFYEFEDAFTQQNSVNLLSGMTLHGKVLKICSHDEALNNPDYGIGKHTKVEFGKRIIPTKVLYVKNFIRNSELLDDVAYAEIVHDIKIEVCEALGSKKLLEMICPRPYGKSTDVYYDTVLKGPRVKKMEMLMAEAANSSGSSASDNNQNLAIATVTAAYSPSSAPPSPDSGESRSGSKSRSRSRSRSRSKVDSAVKSINDSDMKLNSTNSNANVTSSSTVPTSSLALAIASPADSSASSSPDKGLLPDNHNSNTGPQTLDLDQDLPYNRTKPPFNYPPGCGYAFLRFASESDAAKARRILDNQPFGDFEKIECNFYSIRRWAAGDFEEPIEANTETVDVLDLEEEDMELE